MDLNQQTGDAGGKSPSGSSVSLSSSPNGLLSPALLRRLEQFQLIARRRSKSSLRGERRSRARGHSVEFADYRNYVPGDDFRYLDWNLYGRLDRLFLKMYEEERELPVTLFLDASESMSFGEPRKFDFARQIAAAIGYVALCGFDRLSVHLFPENPAEAAVRLALKSIRGRQSSLAYFKRLDSLNPQGVLCLNEALRTAAMQSRHTGLAVILSDFLDPKGYEEGINALVGRGFQINIIQILAAEELSPSTFGDLKLVDSETGHQQEVTFGRYRMTVYQRVVQAYCQRLREFCQSRGARYFLAASNTPLEDLLLKQLRQAEVWG